MAARNIPGSNEKDYLFASESVVADAAGFTHWEDVKAGSYNPTEHDMGD
jgi:amidophosphoribosyltransferase